MKNNLQIAVICNSDSLALPSILLLTQKKLLAGISILKRNSGVLLPLFINSGINSENIQILENNNWETNLTNWLIKLNADVVYVFGFPWKINDDILSIPKFGFLNFHYGLLPKYAGADPIFWQLKNADDKCELMVHQMTNIMDNGPIIFSKQFTIILGENYAMLCSRLGIETAQEILDIEIEGNKVGNLLPKSINSYQFYKKPTISDLIIKWTQYSSQEIECLVNASNPKYGGAITFLGDKEFRILEVSPVDMDNKNTSSAGEVIYADNLYGLIVSCINNKFLRIGVAHLSEGYFSGSKLFNIGIKAGTKFN